MNVNEQLLRHLCPSRSFFANFTGPSVVATESMTCIFTVAKSHVTKSFAKAPGNVDIGYIVYLPAIF